MNEFTHLNASGKISMVDVGEKEITRRRARAVGRVTTTEEVIRKVKEESLAKGDLIAAARVAGIQGAKKTASLIPLCHPLLLDHIEVKVEVEEPNAFKVTAEVACVGRTGVEMEALTATSIACLTIYDMCKALDRAITITDIHLVEKSGGRSGHYENKG